MANEINWSGNLQAVHEHGRVAPATVFEIYEDDVVNVMIEGQMWFARSNGDVSGSRWTIRNTPAVSPAPDERAVALVRKMATFVDVYRGEAAADWVVEACDILAALEPVDPMLLEARKIVADQYGESGNVAHLREQALSGEGDEWFHTKVALAALSHRASRDVTPCTREQFESECG